MATVAVAGETLTAIPVSMIVADALFVVSAMELAVNVIVPGVGAVAGAVYVTATPEALLDADSVPQAAPVHPLPDSAQLTPLPALSLATVAVNACDCPACIENVVGDIVTAIAESGFAVDPPPPQPPTNPTIVAIVRMARANKDRGTHCVCTRIKAVSVS